MRRGFTLIEVLVAVAILGIGLTAIFSSQWVSYASVKHSRLVNESSGLARCKMSEVEWELEQDGFQTSDTSDSGPCCDGMAESDMKCSWVVAKVEFPAPKFGELDLESELDLGAGPSLFSGGGPAGAGSIPGAAALGFLKTGATGMQRSGEDVSAVADSFLSGSEGVGDGIAGLVMQIVYPDLKAIFEAGTRKITVRVSWYEGRKEYGSEIEQWVTSSKEAGLGANMGGLLGGDDEEEDDTATPSSSSTSSKKKTPPSKTTTSGGMTP